MAKKCVASEGLNIEQYSKEALGAVKTNSTADRQEQLSDAPFLQLVTQLSSSHLDEVKDRAMALLCNASDRQFGLLIRRGKVQTLVKVLQQSLRKGRTSRVTEDAALLLAKCKQAGRQEEKPTPAPQARAAAPQGQAQGQVHFLIWFLCSSCCICIKSQTCLHRKTCASHSSAVLSAVVTGPSGGLTLVALDASEHLLLLLCHQ